MAQALLESHAHGDLAYCRVPYAAAVEAQRQADVLGDRQRRQQIERLKDEADPFTAQNRQAPLAEIPQLGLAQRHHA